MRAKRRVTSSTTPRAPRATRRVGGQLAGSGVACRARAASARRLLRVERQQRHEVGLVVAVDDRVRDPARLAQRASRSFVGRDVLARRGDDQVLLAAGDAQVAVGVDRAEVAASAASRRRRTLARSPRRRGGSRRTRRARASGSRRRRRSSPRCPGSGAADGAEARCAPSVFSVAAAQRLGHAVALEHVIAAGVEELEHVGARSAPRRSAPAAAARRTARGPSASTRRSASGGARRRSASAGRRPARSRARLRAPSERERPAEERAAAWRSSPRRPPARACGSSRTRAAPTGSGSAATSARSSSDARGSRVQNASVPPVVDRDHLRPTRASDVRERQEHEDRPGARRRRGRAGLVHRRSSRGRCRG